MLKYDLTDELQKEYDQWLDADVKIYRMDEDMTHPLTDEWVLDWMLKVELDAQAEIEAIKANAEAKIKRAENRVKAAMFKYGDIFKTESKKKLDTLKKGKSVILDHGKIGYRTKSARIEVDDPKRCFDWVEKTLGADIADEAVKVDTNELIKRSDIQTLRSACVGVKVAELNKFFKDTGDVPDGCDVVESSEEFYWKAGK
jgi:hypothetical protein